MNQRYYNKKARRPGNDSLIILLIVLVVVAVGLLIMVANVMYMEDSGNRVALWEAAAGEKKIVVREEATTEIVPEEPLEEIIKARVPLLYQGDARWGNYTYGAGPMETTGCGPTCLSMVAMYLLQRTDLTPTWMADFSVDNGFCVPGNGTSWSFMSEGARLLGLEVEEVAPTEGLVAENLLADNPIICIMGPGDFTDDGHFVVLTKWEDGEIRINDPNSQANSNRRWKYEEIEGQIRNMWVYKNQRFK